MSKTLGESALYTDKSGNPIQALFPNKTQKLTISDAAAVTSAILRKNIVRIFLPNAAAPENSLAHIRFVYDDDTDATTDDMPISSGIEHFKLSHAVDDPEKFKNIRLSVLGVASGPTEIWITDME